MGRRPKLSLEGLQLKEPLVHLVDGLGLLLDLAESVAQVLQGEEEASCLIGNLLCLLGKAGFGKGTQAVQGGREEVEEVPLFQPGREVEAVEDRLDLLDVPQLGELFR